MTGKLATTAACAASLALASAALAAATSPPVGDGHYTGTATFRTYYPKPRRAVTLRVTRNRANFASGRIDFVLNGQAGLGSCAGPTYVTVSPTKGVRQISRAGTFDLRGSFPIKVPIPYPPKYAEYRATVTIKGAFADRGRRVSGTLLETARSKGLTCHSGTVTFTARLVR